MAKRFGVAVAAGLVLTAFMGIATANDKRRPVQLRVGELVQLSGTQVFCRGEEVKEPGAGPALECFETHDGWRGSYEVGISERFVWLEKHTNAGHANVLFGRRQHG